MATELMCAEWSRQNCVDPVGSAGYYRGFLVVDWHLPWPRDVGAIPELQELSRAAAARGVRLQAAVPTGGEANVSLWRWDEGTGRYTGARAPAGPDPVAISEALLDGGRPDGWSPVTDSEVLICGHGRRDRCCGSFGTALAVEVSGTEGPVVRRTSHTGGHRFAPTAILLPEGTCWGYLDAGTLASISGRVGPVDEVVSLYRGCCGLPSPQIQALEREVLREIGWALFDLSRRPSEEEGGRVGLEVTFPTGETRRWTAQVEPGRTLPVPECGVAGPAAGAPTGKTQTEWTVVDLVEST